MMQALTGIKVIDLSRVLGGPYCTQILGDHGADIIKVEPPRGDETREWGPPFKDGSASYFIGVNRNKKSISLDLSKGEGRDILLKLLEDADILIENFKIGTLEKWGLGFEDVLSIKFPKLIHCRITGFGEDGPYKGLAGYDAVAQALSGMMSVNGSPELPPVRVGIPIIDLAAGLNAVIGLSMALYEREKSQKGQSIEISLYDTGISLLHPHAANWLLSGVPQRHTGDTHPNICPYSQFETKTCRIFIGCGNDLQFRLLCHELERPEWISDERFKTNGDRLNNREDLLSLMQGLLLEREGEPLTQSLLSMGVPAGAVLTIENVLTHEQTFAREMLVEKEGYKGIGIPIKFSRTPGSIKDIPPAFNQHCEEVLKNEGYSEADIKKFQEMEIVVQTKRV